MVSRKLKLYFKDGSKAQRTISVDYPKDSYTDQDVNTAMDKILGSNVLMAREGLIKEKSKAELETIEKSPYNIIESV